jgi:mRNA interferase MazF
LLASRFAPAPLPVPYFVLVSFPFTDLTSTKRRPALVVSPDSFNELNEDLILAAVTSQVTNSPHSVPVAPTDCQDGSLPKESFVKLTKVFTISSALIVKSICRLRAEKLGEVLAKLRELYC